MIHLKISSDRVLPAGLVCLLLVNSYCSVQSKSLCWPYNLVPYAIDPAFSSQQRQYIEQLVEKLNKQTCVYWVDMEARTGLQQSASYVRFEWDSRDRPCQSSTRYPGGGDHFYVTVSLGDHCFERAIVLHEMVHALGFEHEHQRIDRDCYVWVRESAKKMISYEIDTYFSIPNIDRFPYDKQSVMHYKRSGDLKALGERWYEWEPLGSDEERLTDLDLWKIQYRYCGRPHYCDVYPDHCERMEQYEAARNCTIVTTPSSD